MTPVLNCLLCALIGALLVSAWILAGVLWLLRDYLIAKTGYYRFFKNRSEIWFKENDDD